jgi:hypothetical protein
LNTDKLFFVITGNRMKVRQGLYQALMRGAAAHFPDLPIAFIGSPFDQYSFSAETIISAQDELEKRWEELIQFVERRLEPALRENQVVIANGFGLDALLYAIALAENELTIESLEHYHHNEMVARHLKARGITLPTYGFIRSTGIGENDPIRGISPLLRDIDNMRRRELYMRQEDALRRYFHPEHGQMTPITYSSNVYAHWLFQRIVADIRLRTSAIKAA